MIKFENTNVTNFDGALRGMRNPMNSWDNTDSYWAVDASAVQNRRFIIGKKDMYLAQTLIKAGSDHRKFMRQILVSVDITAPLYWWKEFDTYKVGTVANSCSTMHKIHDKEITLADFSYEHLDDFNIAHLYDIIRVLNSMRALYVDTKNKHYWWQIIQLLPSSYNQKRTVTLNYEVLLNIYRSRQNHKLDEWSVGFMDWISSLPYADQLIKI
jgi:hypothetical protein